MSTNGHPLGISPTSYSRSHSARERDKETELSMFSQTLQTTMTSSAEEIIDLEKHGHPAERAQWVLNAPKPPGIWRELVNFASDNLFPQKLSPHSKQTKFKHAVSVLESIFPILLLCRNYNGTKFKKDLLAGLTLASLSIPQSIGYATLAKLDPEYGLYTSILPPLIYALMGSSREIAIGPVAVVSLLLSTMIQKLEDPLANPISYRRLVFTVTFFTGVFQAAFGLLRLGFLVDFLSHAAIVGFMAGAATMIGLQQLKGLLGITYTTNKTDVVSVLKAVFGSIHYPWNPRNFMLGCSFLSFILIARFVGRKNKKLYWLPAIAPLVSVILSTLFVFLTRADKHGVKIVKHIHGGFNPSSVHELQFNGPHTCEVVKIGLIVAVIALTEAVAVSRSFATIKGYHLDGNKEMMAMGFMNIAGSLTSCYAATGSFSRTAVNFSAGCETVVSNIVMAITVLISMELLTRLLYFTPIAILASIILSALPGLIDLHEAHNIWKVDKLDFLACIGAFFGVLFVSVEIGLLVAVIVSFAKIIINSIQPGLESLGRFPGTDIFCDVHQYPMAIKSSEIHIIRVKSAFLCFANANFIRERILKWVIGKEEVDGKGSVKARIKPVILDMSNLVNIDTSGIASLKELHNTLVLHGIKLAIANPRWQVIHKLRLANFVDKIGGMVFLTVGEAVEACVGVRMGTI
ncbi:low affinity sulfate transporter 3 [Cornus florida]|uniref:low affinity sulfate transporter 3 n=1 Tax=Cornus florida TaxID=4283 RepID=UPI00289BB923|nr:low affinity sulfate transporter 3 [Cornus florida]